MSEIKPATEEEVSAFEATWAHYSGVPPFDCDYHITECMELIALIRQQQKEIERLGGGWRPIETAPKDDTKFLGCEPAHDYYFVCWKEWKNDDGSPVYFNGDVVVEPTHWMPLPAVPVVDK